MQVTPASILALQTAISLLFNQGRTSVTPVWSDFANKVTSTTRSMHFPQNAALRRLQKWDGERKVVSGKTYDYVVTPDKFELTASIPLEDVEDDNVGAYNAMIEDMGSQSALWPDDLAFDALLAGETEASFDGKPFFANNHQLAPGKTIDNLFESTPLTKDNLATILAVMMSYVGEDGRSLRVKPTLLAVPPALEDTARSILQSDIVAKVFGSNTAAAAVDNTMQARLQLKVYSELAASAGGSDTDYYILDTSRSVKPIVIVERKAPMMTFKDRPDDDSVFWDDAIVLGVRARGRAGYGPFHLAAKAKG